MYIYQKNVPGRIYESVFLDTGGDVGLYSSVGIDSNDNRHVSYYDATNDVLKYAKYDGASWSVERVDDGGGMNDVGQYSSIAVEPVSGIPHISYYDATNKKLKYVTKINPTTWGAPEDPDPGSVGVGQYSSIALDSGGLPHISYYDAAAEKLKYVKKINPTTWDIPENPDSSSGVGQYSSIALDSGGLSHISYYDASAEKLKYVTKINPTTWGAPEDPDPGSVGVGQYSSIALDSGGLPHISYYDAAAEKLKYVNKNIPAIWDHPENPDSSSGVGQYSSIALDSNGNEHIGYYDDTNKALKYAKWDSSTSQWAMDTVPNDPLMLSDDYGEWTSIALDAKDLPHISYFDADNWRLKYAYWDDTSTPAEWKIETVDQIYSGGKFGSSIALDPNNNYLPRISYYNAPLQTLWFATRDASGSWSTQEVDFGGGGDVGRFSSLALDSAGDAHISYYDNYNMDLKYARQTGPSSWIPEPVDSDQYRSGEFTSIALDPTSENPRISYYSYTFSELRMATWDGSQWVLETVDDANDLYDVGLWSSLEIDAGGLPHIAYHDISNGDLKYIKAQTWGGLGWDWAGMEVVHSDGHVGEYASLALDSANEPHISYFDNTDNFAIYQRRTSIHGGGAWTNPTLVSEIDIALPQQAQVEASGKHVHVVWTDTRDFIHTGNTYIYYKKSDTTGITWPGNEVQISSDFAEPFHFGSSPRIGISGATLEIVWQHVYWPNYPSLPVEFCAIMSDINRLNGVTEGWGSDIWVAPNPVPDQDWYCANRPDIAIDGNNRHLVYQYQQRKIFPPPENQYPDPMDISYAALSDTMEPSWSNLPSPPGGLSGISSVHAYYPPLSRNQVFVIGGETQTGTFEDRVWRYDLADGTYVEYCRLPDGVAYTSAVFHQYRNPPEPEDNKIFVFFGRESTGAVNKISYIDLDDPYDVDRCVFHSSFGGPRYGTSAVIDNDVAYVFGGYDGAFHYLDDIIKFEVRGSTTLLGPLPSPRAFTSAVWDENGEVGYVIGGEILKGPPTEYLDQIVMFDPSLPGLTKILDDAKLPTARGSTSAVIDGTFIYIFGGVSQDGPLDDIVRFNPKGGWRVGVVEMCSHLLAPVKDSSAVMTMPYHSVIDGGIWIVGGEDHTGAKLTEIARYFPSYWYG